MPRKIALVLLAIWLLGASIARAQSDFFVSLTPPQTSQFPVISTYLDVHGPGGDFVRGLSADQVTLLEDDQPVQIQDIQETQPGIELMLAINTAPSLAHRDGEGRARHEQIGEALTFWAESAPASAQDRYHLMANGTSPSIDLPSPAALLEAYNAFQPDYRSAEPSLDSLAAAIDMATNLPAASGQERAILLITPQLERDILAALPGLRERAISSGAHVYVWMVAPVEALETPGAQELTRLASDTRGQFFLYTGVEPIPDLEDYLGALRSLYAIQYQTQLRASGEHSLSARLTLPEGEFVTPPQTFQLDIQAPNPMFISPPVEVARTSPAGSSSPLQDLTPASIPLRILVEFPDGKQRAITRASLYVDGKLAAERNSPPFDQFEWDISGYTTSGLHSMRVEVEDSLGLVSSGMETPVEVKVSIPPVSFWTRVTRSNLLPSAAAVLIAGASLGLVLFMAGRRRSRKSAGLGSATREPVTRSRKDPLTQPVTIPGEPLPKGNAPGRRAEKHSWTERLNPAPLFRTGWPKRGIPTAPAAVLVRLGENNEPLTGAAIPLGDPEITFGHDPTQATCVLEDATLDGLHARLRIEPDGSFILTDQGSLAGTWVNYAPISGEGVRLEHGDLIHLGRLAFRFNLSKPTQIRKPTIQVYDERV